MTNDERFDEVLRLFQLQQNQELEANQGRPIPSCLQLEGGLPETQPLKFDRRVGVPSGLRWVRTHREPHPGTAPPQENAAEPQSPRVRPIVREPKNEG